MNLTRREMEILEFLKEGLPTKTIAYRMGCSESTVKVHLAHAYRKANVKNRLQLVMRSLNGEQLGA